MTAVPAEADGKRDGHAQRPVLILGAGINGASLARELVLNGVPVWLVDLADIAGGATAKASRLIHGGLRYLEYGDVRLVRESLEERSRLRRLAPQFVRPLRLYVPVETRTAGMVQAALRFFGAGRSRLFRRMPSHARGLWVVRFGLWMYDRLASDEDFPPSRVVRASSDGIPRVDPARYRWMCGYSDAQMPYPERYVVALLTDARRIAEETGTEFRVLPYHRTELHAAEARLQPRRAAGPALRTQPAAIANATGAWGDLTLGELRIPAPRLLGGTKGSHFLTYHRGFRESLGGDGVYAEAPDGRLIFVLPLGDGVLVGTTDERFEGPPERAVASEEELSYLLDMANRLFPEIRLTRANVTMHYSGVRPLPYMAGETTAAISRDHFIRWHPEAAVPVMTLVGGKLTTARALAELAADQLFAALNIERTRDSRSRVVPGGENYPAPETLRAAWQDRAARHGLDIEPIGELWSLCGTDVDAVLRECAPLSGETLTGTTIPVEFVRWVIQHEWVTTLADLVERRLMLLYRPSLSRETLQHLADCLVEAGRLEATEIDAAVDEATDRLRMLYGRCVTSPMLAAQ